MNESYAGYGCELGRKSEFPLSLHSVLKNGSKAKIDEILSDTTNDLECPFENGDTAYHVILRNNRLTEEDIIDIFEIFRTRGIDSNTKNNQNGKAAIHYAIENRMRSVTDFLMRYRDSEDVTSTTLTTFFVKDEDDKFWHRVGRRLTREKRQQMLHDSFMCEGSWTDLPIRTFNEEELQKCERIESESASFLEWLISKEPDFDRKNDQGKSSIDVAIENNLQHLLLVLLRRLSKPALYPYNLSKFLFSSRGSNKHDELCDKKNVWYSGYNSRYTAEILKILFKQVNILSRGGVGRYSRYIRKTIGWKEDIGIIKMLVDHFTATCDKREVVTTLLQELMLYSVADLTDSEIDCYRQILNDLVAKGADLNGKNDNQMTLIEIAVYQRNQHAIVWLDEMGVDFDVSTENAENLLYLSLTYSKSNQFGRRGNLDSREAVIDLLVDKGCDVNTKDSNGESLLHYMAKYRVSTTMRKLIERGADVNCRDKDMRTPLHYLVRPYHRLEVEMIEFFLENGANVNAKNSNGESLLYLALTKLQHEIVKVLLKRGAQVNALYEYDDEKLLSYVVNTHMLEEFLKYGLDINNTPSCNYLYRCSCMDTPMEQHCIKLKAAELQCSEDYSSRSEDKRMCQDYYEECLKEIETLKATFIDSRTSIYDFLRMNLSCRCAYINNEKLKSLVDSPNHRPQFPLYSTIILARYREATARRSLMEPAKAAWLELTEIGLPDICIECILSYLSNVNLVNMIEP